MGQPGREHQLCAIVYGDDNLVGIISSQFCHGRFDHVPLMPWIVEVNRVCSFARLQIIDSTEKIVGMVIHLVNSARRVHIGPEPGHHKRGIGDL